jgi:hypothetical protein
VRVWKQERSQVFSGTIIPIGAAPDGTSWTGFASVGADRRSGHLLLFRELNEQATWSAPMPVFGAGPVRLTKLAGHGSGELSGGRLTVTIPKAQDYLWLKVTPAD